MTMKIFKGRVRKVLVVALLLVVVLSVVSSTFDLDLPNVIVQAVMKPLRGASNALVNQAEEIYGYLFRYESMLQENEELKEQLAEMEDDARTADALQREVERLKALLELTGEREDFVPVDAYIIGWDSNDWSASYTIDKGTRDGIAEGQCVITANGEVVGLITEVGPNYAVLKSVLDSSLEISSIVVSTGYNGMVHGGYATGETGMLRMDYLPADAIIRSKDQVVTAGSTLYPRDLLIGYVVDAGFDASGASKYAVLEPAADFDSLEQVFVLTSYDTEG